MYYFIGHFRGLNCLTVIVNRMVNSVIVGNDAQYGMPAMMFNATHGV